MRKKFMQSFKTLFLLEGKIVFHKKYIFIYRNHARKMHSQYTAIKYINVKLNEVMPRNSQLALL